MHYVIDGSLLNLCYCAFSGPEKHNHTANAVVVRGRRLSLGLEESLFFTEPQNISTLPVLQHVWLSLFLCTSRTHHLPLRCCFLLTPGHAPHQCLALALAPARSCMICTQQPDRGRHMNAGFVPTTFLAGTSDLRTRTGQRCSEEKVACPVIFICTPLVSHLASLLELGL